MLSFPSSRNVFISFHFHWIQNCAFIFLFLRYMKNAVLLPAGLWLLMRNTVSFELFHQYKQCIISVIAFKIFLCFQKFDCDVSWYSFFGGVSLSASTELLCRFISLVKSGEFCSLSTFSAPLPFNSPGTLRIQILDLLLLFQSPPKFFSLFYAVHFLSVVQSGQFLFSTLQFTDCFCSPLHSVIDSTY